MERGIRHRQTSRPAGAAPGACPPVRACPTAWAPRRAVGFFLLAGAAMALLAAVVLLPPWAGLAGARYDLARLQAEVADAEAQIAANERLIAALPHDEVLAKRLAMNQNLYWPRHEIVVVDPDAAPADPPDVVCPPRQARPPMPAGLLIRAAGRLRNTAKRRGMLILAAAALAAAMFLFPPAERPTTAPGSL